MGMKRGTLAVCALAVVLTSCFAGTWARADEPGAAQSQVATILQRLADNPAAPQQYSADVKLHVRLRIFPWISVTLKGSEAYKHPGLYHFVFRGVPKAAEHFSDMAWSLGDPAAWSEKYEVALLQPVAGGKATLRLTPKTSGLVKSLDVTVDLASGRLERAVWSRNDGGTIAVTQHYQTVEARDVVAEQHASIRIPHMAADLVATYSNFSLAKTVASADRP